MSMKRKNYLVRTAMALLTPTGLHGISQLSQ